MMKPAKDILNNITLKDIPAILPLLSESDRHQLLLELETLQDLKNKELSQEKFIEFVKALQQRLMMEKLDV